MKSQIPYSEKLKHPKWQKKRLDVLSHAQWRCQICGSKDVTLNVHHSYYLKNKDDPWQYPTGSLIATCESCHDIIHKTVKQKQDYSGRWMMVWESFIPDAPPIQLTEPEPFVSKFAALKKMLEELP